MLRLDNNSPSLAAMRRQFGYRRLHVLLNRKEILLNQKKLHNAQMTKELFSHLDQIRG